MGASCIRSVRLCAALLCVFALKPILGLVPRQCKDTVQGTTYAGTLSKTSTGRTCQKWGDQNPHAHNFGDGDFGAQSLEDVSNFCRNPDGSARPWCFTTDPDVIFNYCYILMCDPAACDEDQYKYNTTLSGRSCQAWAAQTPHEHRFGDPSDFPGSSVESASNFCRNPDDDVYGPWCYTADPEVMWEYCAEPRCQPPPAA